MTRRWVCGVWLVVMLAGMNDPATAQESFWEPTPGGPFGAVMVGITKTAGNIMLAATMRNGVYQSRSNGAT